MLDISLTAQVVFACASMPLSLNPADSNVISAIPPPTSLWRISGFLQERGDEPWYKQMAYSHNFLFILWPTCLDEDLSVRFVFRSIRTRGKTSVWVISESLWKAVHYITSRWVLHDLSDSVLVVHFLCTLVYISDHWFSGLFVRFEGKPGRQTESQLELGTD